MDDPGGVPGDGDQSEDTRQDEHDSSTQDDLLLHLLCHPTDLGAFESKSRDDDGGQTEQQGQDHQSPAGLEVSWQTQDRLEPAALDGPQRVGGAAHPQAFKLRLTGGD